MSGIDDGNLAPVQDELDETGLAVEGRLPAGLEGVLFRNGPNPQFERPGAHWFHGDGMVHAVSFDRGVVSYRNRWVRTARFLAERAAGGPLDRVGGDTGRANTNIVRRGGRMLALEEAHAPVAISPETLLPASPSTLPGWSPGQPFTAHPKIDPGTGEMLFFNYGDAGPFTRTVRVGALDIDDALAWSCTIELPFAAMIHDFAVTERHVVIPVFPLVGSAERARAGEAPYVWEPARGGVVVVLPRGGTGADVVWHRAPAGFAFHVGNAWEADGRIEMDLLRYEAPPLFPREDAARADGPEGATPWRWSLPVRPGAGAIEARRLASVSGEFPRIDDRFAGRPTRWSWLACRTRPGGTLDGIVRLDGRDGGVATYAAEPGDHLSEPVPVPRSPDAAEGEAWLLVVRWSRREGTSTLLVLDGADLAAGPAATVRLPRRVPAGFHGNWVARAELAA